MLQVTTGGLEGFLAAGRTHHAARRFADAEAAYLAAYAIFPDHPELMLSLGTLALDAGNMPMAVRLLSRAVELNPNSALGFCNLGLPLQECGRLDDAIAALRRALELDPNLVPAASALLLMLQYHPNFDAAAILEESRRWNDGLVNRLAAPATQWNNERSAQRRIRVGYVSADPAGHPVSRFMRPLLARHDRGGFGIHFYSLIAADRGPAEMLRQHTDAWHDLPEISDDSLAALIRREQIDILVDLSMHTAGGRPLLFARKPAPVQVCYLAYPGTTGLAAIDYRLGDDFLDPPGTDAFYSEKTVRLRSFWCFEGPGEAPGVEPAPALSRGFVTFGCLNNFAKLSAQALAAFGAILRAVRDSRLILFCPAGGMRARALAALGAGGTIDPARVEFVERQPLADYFKTYHRIDVALDPFPFCGGTTTCDALWMGAPVVTLRGNKPVARSGATILSNANLVGTIAQSVEEYVEIARELCADVPALAQRRPQQRERMKKSPLMDGPGFTREVEGAFRRMWQAWCAE